MVHYKLSYFALRGRGEIIRYIFHYAGQEFDDVLVSSTKQNPDMWKNMKNSTPFGRVPVLHIDGIQLGDSWAIGRYLAKKFDLVGDNDFDSALCDQIFWQINDATRVMGPVVRTLFSAKDKTKEELDKVRAEFCGFLTRWENMLAANENGHLVGKKDTWADLGVAEYVQRIQMCIDSAILNDFPKLSALIKRVHSIPNIKKYTDGRPHTTT